MNRTVKRTIKRVKRAVKRLILTVGFALPDSFRARLIETRLGTYLVGKLQATRLNPKLPSDAKDRIGAAKAALQDRHVDQAVSLAAEAVALYPDYAETYITYVDALLAAQDGERALGAAGVAFILNPEDPAAGLALIRASHAFGDASIARVNILDAVRASRRSGSVLWAACKRCQSPDMLDDLIALCRDDAGHLSDAQIRPLINAACRVEAFGLARQLVQEATESILESGVAAPVVKSPIGHAGLDALRDAVELLDAAGIPFFAAAGTALGIVREGRPLAHDMDIDLGVFEEHFDTSVIVAAFTGDPRFTIDLPHPKNPKVGIKHVSGASIDVFRYYREGDLVYHNGVFVRWGNTPFELNRHEIDGFSVQVPAPEDLYLTENYGDWRTPDKAYDAFISGNNREVVWSDYYAVHLFRSVYIALRNRNSQKIQALGQIALDDVYLTDEEKAVVARVMQVDAQGFKVRQPSPVAARPSGRIGSGTKRENRGETVQAVLDSARSELSSGDNRAARTIIAEGLRSGLWSSGRLWARLATTMSAPSDYGLVRELWLEAPGSVRHSAAVLKAVARAACMAGQHAEGRALLRRACLNAVPLPVSSDARDNSFSKNAAVALKEMRDVFAEVGIQPFLISGTLLGLVRDGEVIGWDKDIDVGVFASDEELRNLELHIHNSQNFTSRRLDVISKRLRVRHKIGVGIDVFPHYLEGDILWHDGAATRWWNTPFELKEADFLGVTQYIPSNPELYLDENYGDWRTPDPYFDARLDAPNLEVTDEGYRNSLLYFTLLDSILYAKEKKRERYILLISEFDGGPWTGRLA